MMAELARPNNAKWIWRLLEKSIRAEASADDEVVAVAAAVATGDAGMAAALGVGVEGAEERDICQMQCRRLKSQPNTSSTVVCLHLTDTQGG